ncbi:MAG: ORC1-type DNA replication protein [Methanomassiliicoccaceae archaeon]|nr:ORC1-type DNA replication protein [Methanomassiliicoccaceae archaeon]
MGRSIFAKHIDKRNKIVKNKSILQTSYLPEALPHRSGEIDEIATIIASAFEGDKPSNILIFGQPGTGKTAVMNFIGNELRKEDPDGERCVYVYINCEIVDTQYGILQNIGNQIITDFEKRIPTGWSLEKVYSETKNYIDVQNKVFVIVLDEVDRLVVKSGDDVLYHLSKINEDLKQSKLSLVGISNNTKFVEFLDPRVKSRLGEEKKIFYPYSAQQLGDILRSRAELAFEPGGLEDGVISLCAALSAQEQGDARRALSLLRIAAEIAERNGDATVAEAHVKSAKSKIELDVVSETVKALTQQSKTVLMSIIHNTKNDNKTMTTGDVYSTYNELCDVLHVTVLTQRRVTDLISELDMLGIIHARVKSFGRAGRTKEIELSIPQEICRMLEDDESMRLLKNYRPPKQTTLSC